MSRISTAPRALALGVCLLVSFSAGAFVPYSGESTIKGPAIPLPAIVQETSDPAFQGEMAQGYAPFVRFREEFGSDWFVRMDRRTLRPAMIWGAGIPWIQAGAQGGPAGSVFNEDAVKAELQARAREFMGSYPDLLGIDPASGPVSLAPARVVGIDGGRVWQVEFPILVQGVPVDGAAVIFRVNNGNLIQLGIRNVADSLAYMPAVPRLSAEQARKAAFDYAGVADLRTTIVLDEGSLHVIPTADNPRAYDGVPGLGLDYTAAWRVSFRRKGETPTWVAYIDSRDGTVAAFFDANAYACVLPPQPRGRVSGGVFKRHPQDPEEVRALQFVTVAHGGNLTTDANGTFPQTAGVASQTGLDGAYFNITCSTCQNPAQASVTNATGGDLFLGVGGNNILGNGLSTKAERNAFYHLNRARSLASQHLTDAAVNGYFSRNAPINVNVGGTCNAFWDGTSINLYMAGGGCGNMGEISDVGQHEWGHGIDQYALNGGVIDGARGEGLSDIVSVLLNHNPVMAPYFFDGDPSGIRNVDENTSPRGFLSVSNLLTKCGGGGGPLGGEVHCEGEIFGQANWRLGVNLRTKYGEVGGWYALERIFFGHLPLANTYVPDQTLSAYDAYIAVDDDNGNLADGTPNAEAINDAFNAHEIASTPRSGDSAECAPPTAPAPTLTLQRNAASDLYQVVVSFNGLAGATRIDVLRNESGANDASSLIASLTPPFAPNPIRATDDNVLDGVTYFYRIRVAGPAPSRCVSINNPSQSITVPTFSRISLESFQIDDSAANINGVVEPGETITLPATLENVGMDAHNTVATLQTPTPGVTVVRNQAVFGTIASGALDASDAPHFAFQVDNNAALCGDTIQFFLTIEADEGCSYASFTIPIGVPDGSTLLLFDDMETDTGWRADPNGTDDATTGLWVRGDPNPTTYVPDDDHTPTGTQCWITGNVNDPGNAGRDDVDGGCTSLQSPAGWDFGGRTGAELSYWRYYVLETSYDDQFLAEISNDGGMSWRTLETVGQTTTPFTEARFDLDNVLGAPAGRVALRVTLCDTGGGSLTEALLDDVTVEVPKYRCDAPGARPRLTYSAVAVDDGTSQGTGNADGIADPYENIVLQVSLRNVGNAAAEQVTGTLRLVSSPAGVRITDNASSFPDIAVGATQMSDGPAPQHFGVDVGNSVQHCGATMDFELNYAYTGAGTPYTDTAAFSVRIGVINHVVVFFDDFETAGDNGWTHAMIAEQDDWMHDAPSGNNFYDASYAYSGAKVWGNDLAPVGSNWDGNYRPDVHNYLESPAINMSPAVNSRLHFMRWLSVEDGQFDEASVSVNGTQVWRNPVGGGSDHVMDTSWMPQDFDISAIADGNASVRVRFELQSDPGLEFGGWNLDDVSLTSDEPICHPFGCTTPSPDPVGNRLRGVKTGSDAAFDWTLYTGNGVAYNVYRASSRAELPVAAPSLRWSSYSTLTLADPIQPADPLVSYYVVKALNDCPREE